MTILRADFSPRRSSYDPELERAACDRARPSPDAGTPGATRIDLGGVAPPGRTRVEERIDGFFEAAEGPYRDLDGVRAMVPFQFRMNGGANDENVRKHHSELASACNKARLRVVLGELQAGRATPSQLVAATQALIDDGRLLHGSPADFGERVRAMQWSYGIGMDCVGYVEHAFAAARGLTREQVFGGSPTDGLKLLPGVATTVGIRDAQPGDLITLLPPKGERFGHNVLCRSHVTMTEPDCSALAMRFPDAPATFFAKGPVHVFEVDASWGAGPGGAAFGGLHRRTWLFDEASSKWGWTEHGTTAVGTPTQRFVVTSEPYAHPVGAVYRVRDGRA